MKKQKNNKKKKPYDLEKQRAYTAFENSRITFLDPHRYMSFRYVGVKALTAATTVATFNQYNLNSIFYPDETGNDHQPYGFDQMAALYAYYRVLKAKWKVTFPTAAGDYHALVLPLNGTLVSAIATYVTFQTAAETARAKWGTVSGGGAPTLTISDRIDLNELAGVTKAEYLTNPTYESIMTSVPSEVLPLYVAVYNPTGSSITVYCCVEIVFLVDLHDPKTQAKSFREKPLIHITENSI